jgi:hypothetical protein
MAKKKISRRRIEEARNWLSNASDRQLSRYTNLIPPSLQSAAEAFGLDPQSEWHREILVRILAGLMFGKGKKGRPSKSVKWDWHRAADLGMHFDELKQEKPNIKYSQAAKIIKDRYPEEYADCTEMTLRQRMRSAHEHYEWWQEELRLEQEQGKTS